MVVVIGYGSILGRGNKGLGSIGWLEKCVRGSHPTLRPSGLFSATSHTVTGSCLEYGLG